jgi:hypothetical protein
VHLNHKARWIFSPMVPAKAGAPLPLASEYAVQYEAPLVYNGMALTHCLMNAQQLAAAKAHPELIVLPSLYDRAVIHPTVAEHHKALGVTPTMLLHEALEALAKYHPNFAPAE